MVMKTIKKLSESEMINEKINIMESIIVYLLSIFMSALLKYINVYKIIITTKRGRRKYSYLVTLLYLSIIKLV